MLRLFVLLACALLAACAEVNYMDLCMDGKHQKTDPGPEDSLHGQCKPWKDKSCCTAETSLGAHTDKSTLYNFNWDHCGIMTPECKKHFIQDTCFIECSPNLGPWIQKVESSWRNERIQFAPICKEDCETWYEDCKQDYTCMENWHKGWNWTTGTNQCPNGKTCRKVTEVFPTSKDFCEKLWSNSYKYTTLTQSSGQCLQMWFNATNGNPNVKVAKHYADILNSGESVRLGLLLVLASLCLQWAL
ncbi:folate receptor beta [Bombina bombina]|uniref:folate receptor beta n=1 Tax=Bombina bombina TaxID=8345 RepID=UPI00235AF85E|nr:folate receptor beta [Bombina bombina]